MNHFDLYISKIPDLSERQALEIVRNIIHELLPDSEECISYGIPAFRIEGKCVAGFAKFKNHLTFFPFSGSILGLFTDELQGFTYTKSGIHFTPDRPISRGLIEKIIKKRMEFL